MNQPRSNNVSSERPYTFRERMKLIEEIAPVYQDFFTEHYTKRETALADGSIDDSENEEIYFEGVTFEVNPSPSLGIVNYGFEPLVGPRLDLHLREATGVEHARKQLGRIARYIDARHLAEEFPVTSAITYPNLSRITQKIVGMVPALMTFAPHISENAQDRLYGTYIRYNEFLAKHHREEKPVHLDALTISTSRFVEKWRDQL